MGTVNPHGPQPATIHGVSAAPASGPGLYVHVPFCSAICPYCDFAVVKGSEVRRRSFVETLLAEIHLASGDARPFDTIYFGGGTPSLLAEEELARILDAARTKLGALEDAWIFLEANPEDVSPASVAAWRRLGVRTLSLGVQSFDEDELRFLGRRHSGDEARRAVELALGAGFETVSVDLIYGLPGQERTAWRRNLETAVALAPQHLSCYQLTIHEGTPFGRRLDRGLLRESPEPEQAELFVLTHELLASAGYPAYEVSNFAAGTAHRSRHNAKYWDHTSYLGLGPSAHSFDGRRRFWNEPNLSRYSARVHQGERPVAGEEALCATELALEALMLGLRTTAGLSLEAFRQRFGSDLEAINGELISELAAQGLVRVESGRLALTTRGLAIADALTARLELEPPARQGVQ